MIRTMDEFNNLPGKTCFTDGKHHCCPFDKNTLFQALARVIKEEENDLNSYFRSAYSKDPSLDPQFANHYEDLMSRYRKAINLPFEEAIALCDAPTTSKDQIAIQSNYIRYDLFVDKEGNYFEYQPCCK